MQDKCKFISNFSKNANFYFKNFNRQKTYRQFLTKFNYYSYNINGNDIIALVKVLMYINNEENIKIKISSFTDKKTFTLKEFENIMSFSI